MTKTGLGRLHRCSYMQISIHTFHAYTCFEAEIKLLALIAKDIDHFTSSVLNMDPWTGRKFVDGMLLGYTMDRLLTHGDKALLVDEEHADAITRLGRFLRWYAMSIFPSAYQQALPRNDCIGSATFRTITGVVVTS